MNRNTLLSLLVVVALGLGLWWFIGHTSPKDAQTPTPTATLSVSPSASPLPSPAPSVANITITSPKTNAVVDPLFTVSGRARVFENQFTVQLKTPDGKVVYRVHVMTDAKDAGQFGNYSVKMAAPAGEGTKFIVEALSYSPKGDGSFEGYAKINVTLKTADTDTVNVAFLTGKDCTSVIFAPRTVLKSSDVGYMSLVQLLSGPNDQEKSKGATTQIPADVQINSLVYDRSTLTLNVDFNETLEQGLKNSCQAQGIRSQIVATLGQFLGVNNVGITVNGKTEEAFQQ